MSNAIIKRLGFKVDSAEFQARALCNLAGEENVEILLTGPWQATQSCTVLGTPCHAKLSWDGNGFGIGDHGRIAVRPAGHGALVDIIAHVERVRKEF